MSKKIELYQQSPDFELVAQNGKLFRLSDYRDKKNLILVFNRGFV